MRLIPRPLSTSRLAMEGGSPDTIPGHAVWTRRELPGPRQDDRARRCLGRHPCAYTVPAAAARPGQPMHPSGTVAPEAWKAGGARWSIPDTACWGCRDGVRREPVLHLVGWEPSVPSRLSTSTPSLEYRPESNRQWQRLRSPRLPPVHHKGLLRQGHLRETEPAACRGVDLRRAEKHHSRHREVARKFLVQHESGTGARTEGRPRSYRVRKGGTPGLPDIQMVDAH